MNWEAEVRRLANVEAIRDLARRYAHCVWQRDVEGAVGLFAEDCAMDTGDRPVIRGRAALLEAYQAMLAASELHPMVHNHVIDLQEDRASGTCYLELRARIDGKAMAGLGHYEDRYVRVGSAWKFESRVLAMSSLAETDSSGN